MTITSHVRDHVYQHIRRKLATGEFPPGSHLSTVALARELKLSRMPVREAITQLASEGLVDQIPRMGAVVKQITVADAKDVFAMRLILEGAAAARAAKRITPRQLQALDGCCTELENITTGVRATGMKDLEGDLGSHRLITDLAFHQAIVRAAGSARLQKALADLQLLAWLFARLDSSVISMIERLEQADRSHREIVETLRAHDARAARRAMTRHIRQAREWYLLALDLDPNQGVSRSQLIQPIESNVTRTPPVATDRD